MMPATLSIITNAFPPEERGKAIGTWAGVSAIALAIGPVFGGFLVDHVSWRAIFYINVPVAALAVAVTLFAAHESRDETVGREIDLPGIAALTVGIGAIILALVEGNSWGWGSPAIVGLLLASAAGLAGFVVIEQRSRAPMVDFDFFRSRSFLGASLVAFVVSFAMLGVFFFIALFMQNVLGYSPLQAGALFLPATVVIMFLGPIAGRLTDRVGPRPLITAGMLTLAASLLWQSFLSVDSTIWFVMPGFFLMGVGIAFVMSPMSTAAMNSVDRTKAGVASGVLSMSRMVGGSFGVAAMGALIIAIGGSRLGELLPRIPRGQRDELAQALGSGGGNGAAGAVGRAMNEAFVSAVSTGLRLSAAFAVAGALLGWLLIAPRRRATEAPAAEPAAAAAPAGVEPQGAPVSA
jgi:EmrB/QacA subfamily drug resistance transporter